MKKIFLFLSFTFSFILSAQTVTTVPAIITDDYTGIITITYDPAGGAMATATNCYAHIGVTIGGVKWQCAPAWRSGLAKHKLVKNGTKWVLTIDNMYNYFTSCPGLYQELSMVFNDGVGGTKEGKTAAAGDFFVSIAPAGELSVKFSPTSSSGAISSGSTVNFSADATSASDLTIKKNGVVVKTATNVTTISYSEVLNNVGDYVYTVEAVSGVKTSSDSRSVAIISTSESQPRPSGLVGGITYNTSDNTKAHLCLYAKDRNNVLPDNVFVVGDFNNWAISNAYQLKRDADSGYWWIEITGLQPGVEYAFQYAVKIGTKVVKISDPYSEKVLHTDDQWEPKQQYPNLKAYPVQGDGYVSVLQTNKTKYNWSAETLNFIKPNKDNLVIYELWVHDFTSIRSFNAITDRLSYLQNLGVNAIQIMPITEFEGNISWGYNPTHYFAVDKSYGTENDLKKLIDECHKRGIAVILDMVFNHATGAAPQAKMYWGTNSIATNNPWFNQIAPHGSSVNQDYDHNFPQTREMFKRTLKYWIDEYKVDGYRMDLSHGFCGSDCGNRSEIMFDYYNNGVKAGNQNAYFILEHWEETPGERQNYVNNGMMCHTNNTNSYQQTAMGWLKDGDDLNGSNQDGFLSYCESHDEERIMYKAKAFGNGTTVQSVSGHSYRAPLNTAFNVLLNGAHMMWMFQELAYDYSIFSNSTGAVGNRVDPKPVPESLNWYTTSTRMDSYQKIGQLIQLRTRILPNVFSGNPSSTDLGSGKAARSIIWGSGNDRVFVVGNFNAPTDGLTYTGTVAINLPSGNNWFDYLADGNSTITEGTSITLQPGELKIYTASRYTLPNVPNSYTDFTLGTNELSTEDTVLCKVYPTLADEFITVDTKEAIRNIQIIGMNGSTFSPTLNHNKIDLTKVSSGLYLLHVTFNNNKTKTVKFFKN
ncbi:alpha-amylase family glycosyl hydrolase [Flavobacterium psychrotolerans]|uniref:Glycosyl hydrolase family 13 catalytic domain-containing protein n=1 Tax=Flavobacterium psychrotolerans TaxID=2169410 RepID=A0A2U1JM34_9FLAO|nr:alpha-amylase family glycosyl hydrolase [Flavobacterium psychrotolerans]PWA05933.1 hypothetical protein DB895_05800 [Flavobacterium psychrotolerans]